MEEASVTYFSTKKKIELFSRFFFYLLSQRVHEDLNIFEQRQMFLNSGKEY